MTVTFIRAKVSNSSYVVYKYIQEQYEKYAS